MYVLGCKPLDDRPEIESILHKLSVNVCLSTSKQPHLMFYFLWLCSHYFEFLAKKCNFYFLHLQSIFTFHSTHDGTALKYERMH